MTAKAPIALLSERPEAERGHERAVAETATRQRLFGIDEASVRIGLPVWRIYSEVASARMPCKRVGRRVYFTDADLLAYFQRIQRNGMAEEKGEIDGEKCARGRYNGAALSSGNAVARRDRSVKA